MPIQFLDAKTGDLEFVGQPIDCQKVEGTFGPQWAIIVKPIDKEWKNINIWLGIGESTTDQSVNKESQLGVYLHKLVDFGMEGNTIEATMMAQIGHSFVFKKQTYGKSAKESWLPIKLAPKNVVPVVAKKK